MWKSQTLLGHLLNPIILPPQPFSFLTSFVPPIHPLLLPRCDKPAYNLPPYPEGTHPGEGKKCTGHRPIFSQHKKMYSQSSKNEWSALTKCINSCLLILGRLHYCLPKLMCWEIDGGVGYIAPIPTLSKSHESTGRKCCVLTITNWGKARPKPSTPLLLCCKIPLRGQGAIVE